MNKEDNLQVIKKVGDVLQLKYGNDFGYFSVHVSKNQLHKFCNMVNSNTLVKDYGFLLDAKQSLNNTYVTLVKNDGTLSVPIRLLDHTIYIDATDKDWTRINPNLFAKIHKLWRKFLAIEVEEYREHMRKTSLLS